MQTRIGYSNESLPKPVLFVFGDPSWQHWITKLLSAQPRPNQAIFDGDVSAGSVDRICENILDRAVDKVIIVSHHDTLFRDIAVSHALKAKASCDIYCQSELGAKLSTDKRLMTSFASQVSGWKTIPELGIGEAFEYIRKSNPPLIAKHNSLTEGQGVFILSSVSDLDDFLRARPNATADFLIQPFVSGIEFSVNIALIGGAIRVFEPISKSANVPDGWVHPSRRHRRCPDLAYDKSIRDKLQRLTISAAHKMQLQSLCELEVLIDDDDQILFMEVNPRLSATSRMVSLASPDCVFSNMIDMLKNSETNSIKRVDFAYYTEESPVTRSIREQALANGFDFPEYSFSSRATIRGNTPEALRANVNRFESFKNAFE